MNVYDRIKSHTHTHERARLKIVLLPIKSETMERTGGVHVKIPSLGLKLIVVRLHKGPVVTKQIDAEVKCNVSAFRK